MKYQKITRFSSHLGHLDLKRVAEISEDFKKRVICITSPLGYNIFKRSASEASRAGFPEAKVRSERTCAGSLARFSHFRDFSLFRVVSSRRQ